MGLIDLATIAKWIEANLPRFHDKRLEAVRSMSIVPILRDKNPYLFRTKGFTTADEVVRAVVDAFLSSHEEGIFGGFLEELAIYVADLAYGGQKSGIKGIDLEFSKKGVRHLVVIKSGPNWGNAGQLREMIESFKTAKITLRTNTATAPQIACVNGCCYGRDNQEKGDYVKLCGQRFWELISDDPNLYVELIEPLGNKARERNEAFYKEYGKAITVLTRQFIDEFCANDGSLLWEKIARLSSCNPIILEQGATVQIYGEKTKRFGVLVYGTGKYISSSGKFRIRIKAFLRETNTDKGHTRRGWLPSKVDETLDIPSAQFETAFQARFNEMIEQVKRKIPQPKKVETVHLKKKSLEEPENPENLETLE
jgi:Type II restriction endonuclease EcoO109I